jgi:plastocyanin
VRLRRVLVLVAGVAVLAGGGVALAAVGVDLTSTGPQPATVTVNWGETVVFSNRDSQSHVLEIPRETYTSEAIPPGGTLSYVFDGQAGVYIVRQLGTRVHQGRVVVELDGTVTATAPETILYGKRLVVLGTSTVAGSAVSLVRAVQDDPGTWEELATAEVAEDGTFDIRVELEVGGRFRVEAAAGQVRSTPLRVDVRPKITFAVPDRSVAVGRRVEIAASVAPQGSAKRALLEVYDPDRKRWQRERSARIDPSGTVTFRHRFEERGRTLVRISLQRSELAPGFAPTTSRWVAFRVA